MDVFPVEIVYHILYWIINPKDAFSCMLTCSLWGEIIHHINLKFENRLIYTEYRKILPAFSKSILIGRQTNVRIDLLLEGLCRDYVLRMYVIYANKHHRKPHVKYMILLFCKQVTAARISTDLKKITTVDFRVSGYLCNDELVVTLKADHAYMEVHRTHIQTKYRGSLYKVSKGAQGGDFAFYLASVGINISVEKFVRSVYAYDELFFIAKGQLQC